MKIQSALISVFYKDGLEPLLKTLTEHGVTIYTTGGTEQFIRTLGLPCVAVESVTNYPSILGGRVKTLHPKIFGGILGRRELEQDVQEMNEFEIPAIDLVIVDLYPFQETVASTSEESLIIEKIDIGGPSMIRAAAKNFNHVTVLASKADYSLLDHILKQQQGTTTLDQRKTFAAKAFEVVKEYDIAISDYFNPGQTLRYGENPHQKANFQGDLQNIFEQLHGKELSYNNLVDVDAAMQLWSDFQNEKYVFFAIIKHTNVCGASLRSTPLQAWQSALQCDPESAFGGILLCSSSIDVETATAINDIFFEVIIAPNYDTEALDILKQKKNRIILKTKENWIEILGKINFKSILNGTITQDADTSNYHEWQEVGGRYCTDSERENLIFANLLCKHLKSNAIAIVKDKQLIGKGCGQTSRIDALRHAIEKAHQFKFELKSAVLASDAFFPFNDCVQIAHTEGIAAFIQPGGSIRDKDSIEYCMEHKLAMALTSTRHFRH